MWCYLAVFGSFKDFRYFRAFGVCLLWVPLLWAGPSNIQFPSGYTSAHVLYAEVDRADNQTVRDLYANPEALEAARDGRELPSGSVLTMEVYKARLDEQGMPLKEDGGRYQKGPLAAIVVMEKRTGWGADFDPALRNGEWEYAKFTADGKRAENDDATPCLKCHLAQKDQDYVFSLKELAASAP